MSKILNYTGNDLKNDTYYAIQQGLIISVSFYSKGVWYIPAQSPVKNSDLKSEIIVIEELCGQDFVVSNASVKTSIELEDSIYYTIMYKNIVTIAYFFEDTWYIPGFVEEVKHKFNQDDDVKPLNKVCNHNKLLSKYD